MQLSKATSPPINDNPYLLRESQVLATDGAVAHKGLSAEAMTSETEPGTHGTDDLRISIEPTRLEELVEAILTELPAFSDCDDVRRKLCARFGLSEDDATLALDRVPGGVVRALSGHPENRPNPIKDPLANVAFEKVWSELPRRHLLSPRKKAHGKWLAWFEELQRQVNKSEAHLGNQGNPP